MTQAQKAAMRQGLEALIQIYEGGLENFPVSLHDKAIDDLTKALANESCKQQPANSTTSMSSTSTTTDEPVAWKQELANVLCRIHRDGGHYIAEHGWRKAIDDADVKVATMNADADNRPPPAAQMRMPKVGDRVICIEDESLATVESLTGGGSPDIRFDDGSRGTYLLRDFAELFWYADTQPAAPAMFGDGLVAIKTLLSRDPCAHAKVAIEMIDAMLAAPEKGGAA